MRVLITGGTGFIGSNLALQLIEDKHEVCITGHDAEQVLPGFEGRIFQPSFVGLPWNEMGKFDVVFHQAAINNTLSLDRSEMIRGNVESSKCLFEETYRLGCRRFVFASSTAIYGNAKAPYRENAPFLPLNPYGESKVLLEKFALGFAKAHPDVVVVGLRYCNVYGPRESHKGKRASMIYQLAQQMVKGEPRIFKDGEQKRDYVYVKDVVRANLLAAQAKKSFVVNCGGGAATTFNHLIRLLNTTLSLSRKTVYIENPYHDRYQSHTECDMALAKELLGFVPAFSVELGIRDYFQSGFLVS